MHNNKPLTEEEIKWLNELVIVLNNIPYHLHIGSPTGVFRKNERNAIFTIEPTETK